MKVFTFAISDAAVYSDQIRCESDTNNVLVTGGCNARVLIEVVGGVRRRAQIPSVYVASGAGSDAIADVVERIRKLLARDRRPVGPITMGAGEFITVIVIVNPN